MFARIIKSDLNKLLPGKNRKAEMDNSTRYFKTGKNVFGREYKNGKVGKTL